MHVCQRFFKPVFLKAKNEEKLSLNLFFSLFRSKTILPILRALKMMKTKMFECSFW